jgi:hypothetical protein
MTMNKKKIITSAMWSTIISEAAKLHLDNEELEELEKVMKDEQEKQEREVFEDKKIQIVGHPYGESRTHSTSRALEIARTITMLTADFADHTVRIPMQRRFKAVSKEIPKREKMKLTQEEEAKLQSLSGKDKKKFIKEMKEKYEG